MFVHVAVPVPNLDLLTYAVPDGVATPKIGARVVVPLGTRVVTGIVVEVDVAPPAPRDARNDESRPPKVKAIRGVLDAEAFVLPEVVALARWTAEYYAAGVGDTIPALLPPMARGGRADAHKTTRVAAITAAGLEALAAAQKIAGERSSEEHAPRSKLSAKQREALELLSGTPTGIGTPALAARGIAADAISRLARHGYISVRHDRVDRDPFAGTDPGTDRGQSPVWSRADPVPTRQLTGEQTAALDRLLALAATGEFRAAAHGSPAAVRPRSIRPRRRSAPPDAAC